MSKRVWTKEEEEYLQEHWGSKSIILIATNLERDIKSVLKKKNALGLQDPKLSFDGITVKLLAELLHVRWKTIRTWIDDYDFPAKKKIFSKKQRIHVVDYEDFWTWAETHRHLLNLSKLEYLSLGKEPEWVKEQRILDQKKIEKNRPWSKSEKSELLRLVRQFRYTYQELSVMLNRTECAILHQLGVMKEKARPIPIERRLRYTQKELQLVVDFINKGWELSEIVKEINKGKAPDQYRGVIGLKSKLKRMGFQFKKYEVVHIPEQYRPVKENKKT